MTNASLNFDHRYPVRNHELKAKQQKKIKFLAKTNKSLYKELGRALVLLGILDSHILGKNYSKINKDPPFCFIFQSPMTNDSLDFDHRYPVRNHELRAKQ